MSGTLTERLLAGVRQMVREANLTFRHFRRRGKQAPTWTHETVGRGWKAECYLYGRLRREEGRE